jgi:polyribonucleotide nucleotidyltransferase
MGIITKGDDWEVLTDIAGIEDHKGDMDFKVAGTRKGITAIQLDVKCTGVNPEQIEKTLEKARIARLHILDNMEATISEARGKLSLFAPRIEAFKVDPDKIREIIGPGGKMIKKITADSGAQIEIDDEGTVHVISSDGNKLELARKMINDIVREVEVGEVYNGTVKRVMNFGAFIEVLPGKEGLCHISELDINRVEKVEDILNLGDECQVKVIEIDAMGRVNLSRKVLLDGYVPRENTREERPPRDSRPPRESRPPRDNNRGPRRDNNRGPRDGNNSGGRDRR